MSVKRISLDNGDVPATKRRSVAGTELNRDKFLAALQKYPNISSIKFVRSIEGTPLNISSVSKNSNLKFCVVKECDSRMHFNSVTGRYNRGEHLVGYVYHVDGKKVVLPQDCSSLFSKVMVDSIDFGTDIVDASQVKSVSNMFSEAKLLVTLNFGDLKFNSLETVDSAFCDCRSLVALDLSGWNTSQVTGMTNLFMGCESLRSVNLEGWSTSNVIDVEYMFFSCVALETVDMSSFCVDSVENFVGMVHACTHLRRLDLAHFHIKDGASVNSMFSGCFRLKELDLSGADLTAVRSMVAMLRYTGYDGGLTCYVNNPSSAEMVYTYAGCTAKLRCVTRG